MRHLKKIFHTAGVERVDPYLKISNYLMQFRATAHATMRKSPAELLFGRKSVTKLPDLRTNLARDRKDIVEAKEEDKVPKDKMKKYKDYSRDVKDHNIKVGNLVITNRKVTLQGGRHIQDPDRHDGKHKTRALQRWKKVEVQQKRSNGEVAGRSRYQDEPNIGAGTKEYLGAGRQVQINARNQMQVQGVLTLTPRLMMLLKEARCSRGPGRTPRPD